jgi:D-glycero-beta-D-manno-heptose 1-phosphate adenylyltransferase
MLAGKLMNRIIRRVCKFDRQSYFNLQTRMINLNNKKLFSLEKAQKIRTELKDSGRKLVITNGCFDLLHPGHIFFLKEARAQGDALWVMLNSKKSIHILKGPLRPILGDQERAYALAALECVDGIIVFGTPRLDKEIKLLAPDVYVKAKDYTLEKLDPNEYTALQTVGADIRFLPFLEGFSTTALIQKIAAAYKI